MSCWLQNGDLIQFILRVIDFAFSIIETSKKSKLIILL